MGCPGFVKRGLLLDFPENVPLFGLFLVLQVSVILSNGNSLQSQTPPMGKKLNSPPLRKLEADQESRDVCCRKVPMCDVAESYIMTHTHISIPQYIYSHLNIQCSTPDVYYPIICSWFDCIIHITLEQSFFVTQSSPM